MRIRERKLALTEKERDRGVALLLACSLKRQFRLGQSRGFQRRVVAFDQQMVVANQVHEASHTIPWLKMLADEEEEAERP